MRLKELLKKGNVIFDGAMGTYLSMNDSSFTKDCELANIEAPGLVLDVHRQYIEAGARAIITNTFAANKVIWSEEKAEKLIDSGWNIAREAAGTETAVIADIGPIPGDETVRGEEYIWVADKFIERGAGDFIFETQSNLAGIAQCAAFIKDRDPDAFIIASFAVNDAGFTAEGIFANDLISSVEQDENIDACGFNCGCSAAYMQKIICSQKLPHKPLLVKPNAGSLTVVGRRTVFKGSASVFADKVYEMASHGAVMLGGCCGTTPDHIRELKDKLSERSSEQVSVYIHNENEKASEKELAGSRFWDRLQRGERPIAVELDPPMSADAEKFMSGAADLKEAGVDIITIADCPIGRARMDSSLLACRVHRELGIEALPHMTCRDRNLNATQALMLGLYSEGIRNILLVTGDPVPSAEKNAIKAVYQFNSRKFAAFASSLKEKVQMNDIHYFGALNVNARNFDIQIRLAKEKLENGISGFLTQPVLTKEAFDNLKRAKDELDGFILGGIIPVVSEKNARFMDSEISGINVAPEVIEMYVGKDREEAEEIAVSISSEIAEKITPYVDGYYLMTPFQRTSLIRKIIASI